MKVGFDSSTDQRKRIENTQKEEKEYYIGGQPPTGKSKRGSTETLREWARSAAENPAPIQYRLSSIDSLLRPNSFKDLSYGNMITKMLRYQLKGQHLQSQFGFIQT